MHTVAPVSYTHLHIRYDEEEGCQIIANPEGCLYLARAFRALALAPSPGAHLSLDYDLPPMVGETYPAMLYIDVYKRQGSAAQWSLNIARVHPGDPGHRHRSGE